MVDVFDLLLLPPTWSLCDVYFSIELEKSMRMVYVTCQRIFEVKV